MSSLSRREFLQMLAAASAAGMGIGCTQGSSASRSSAPGNLYEVAPFGNVSLLHFTDCHAQLKPIYFREPSINLGVGSFAGKPPHLVGDALLKEFKIAPGSIEAHAFTYLNFEDAARQYGKVGGFAHLATLVKSLRDQRKGRTLLLDGGDTWQGSATALWTKGQDMVDAQKLLGVDIMTAHWEFTYGAERVKEIVDKHFKGSIEFLAQNVNDATWGEAVFKPYVIRELNGIQVGIIGQAFPYTPIANPRWMIPDWSFGINDDNMQKMVDKARAEGAKVVVVLSHNGMDVDLIPALRGRNVTILFYEASTRTRVSFEVAAKNLSADVTNIAAATSSVTKGESLVDTVRTVEALGAQMLVMRHHVSGAPYLAAETFRGSVLNAGDGWHAHPTQALLDLYTMRGRLPGGSVEGRKVVILGDVLHSRVARSNIWSLTAAGADLWLCGPPTLLRGFEAWAGRGAAAGRRFTVTADVGDALRDADVVMALRIQRERMASGLLPSLREYAARYGLTAARLAGARPGALVMHPGPMNEGVEIAADVAAGPQSVITDQVTNGVAIRMALLYLLAGVPRS